MKARARARARVRVKDEKERRGKAPHHVAMEGTWIELYDDHSHSHIIVARVERKRMVRFKNRYILVDISNMELPEALTERGLLKLIKQVCEDMMGDLFLAKVTFSLQIKYLQLGKAIIRIPRDHASQLMACLFVINGLRVIKASGVIRGIQKKLFELLRRELRRELTVKEADMIDKIDYC